MGLAVVFSVSFKDKSCFDEYKVATITTNVEEISDYSIAYAVMLIVVCIIGFVALLRHNRILLVAVRPFLILSYTYLFLFHASSVLSVQ